MFRQHGKGQWPEGPGQREVGVEWRCADQSHLPSLMSAESASAPKQDPVAQGGPSYQAPHLGVYQQWTRNSLVGSIGRDAVASALVWCVSCHLQTLGYIWEATV